MEFLRASFSNKEGLSGIVLGRREEKKRPPRDGLTHGTFWKSF
jgi:hypothetical protein